MDNKRLAQVLIIKPSSLGDIIHALPVAAGLKAAMPGVSIDWVAAKGYEGLLSGNPAVRRVITFDRRMFKDGGGPAKLIGFVRELRREKYDLVIDLQGLLRSALMAFSCRAGRRLGLSDAREGAPFFYTETVRVPDAPTHAVERYLLVLQLLGIETAAAPVFTINPSPEDDAEAGAILERAGVGDGEVFVAAAPSARWATKRWPGENFVSLANRLLGEKGIKTVFVGSAGDKEVLSGRGEVLAGNYQGFGQTTLMGLAALLKRARLLVTNDSGPMHLAAAVGTPVIALFGPTDPSKTGPYGTGHKVVISSLDCAPCFRKECGDVKCLSALAPEDVYGAVSEMIGG